MRTGFKQTEVGEIPDDWDVRTLSELGTIKTGPFGTLLKASEYRKNSGVPVISVGEIRDGYIQVNSNTPFVPEKVLRRLPAYILNEGDIAFGRKGSVERSALITPAENGYFLGSDGMALRVRIRCSRQYIANQLRSWRVRTWMIKNATGTTMAGLNQKALSRVAVPIPPTIEEQEAIAGALGDADALIESLERLIEKKRMMKQGAMQDLLTGKKRLPGFSGDWVVKKLGSILTILHGRSQKEVETTDGQYPILATGGQIGWATMFMYDKPSVLIGRKGSINKPQFMQTPFWTVDTLFYSEIHRPHHAKFIYFKFCLIDWNLYNEASGVPSLNAKTIESIEVAMPPTPEEQDAIVDGLSSMDAEIDVLIAKLEKAKHFKQGMMQQLLTGKIRLR